MLIPLPCLLATSAPKTLPLFDPIESMANHEELLTPSARLEKTTPTDLSVIQVLPDNDPSIIKEKTRILQSELIRLSKNGSQPWSTQALQAFNLYVGLESLLTEAREVRQEATSQEFNQWINYLFGSETKYPSNIPESRLQTFQFYLEAYCGNYETMQALMQELRAQSMSSTQKMPAIL